MMMNKTQTLPTLALTTMITLHEIDDNMSLMTILDRHHGNLRYLVLPQDIARDAHKTRLKGFILLKRSIQSNQDKFPGRSPKRLHCLSVFLLPRHHHVSPC